MFCTIAPIESKHLKERPADLFRNGYIVAASCLDILQPAVEKDRGLLANPAILDSSYP